MRIAREDVRIELCDENDAEKIAEGVYVCYPDARWTKEESAGPDEMNNSTPINRLAKRFLPSLTEPHMKWIKAVLVSTGETVGAAGWVLPSNPEIHTPFRRSAYDHYGWKAKMGWTDEEIDALFAYDQAMTKSQHHAQDDEKRREIMRDEKHWYLALLLTWPAFQGRGIGRILLNWGIEQADGTDPVTPIYLESSAGARAVYLRCGFVPVGERNMIRRRPAIARKE